MVRQGFGHIVNTASLAGLIGEPMSIPYVASKFAIVGLSTTLRLEAAGLGIKVSVVCPGESDRTARGHVSANTVPPMI
jgi:short-subunit dehydrogenase